MTRNNIAEQVFNDAINAIRESQSGLEKTISGYASGISGKPLVDIIEDENNLIVKADFPGFKKENIKINISDSIMEILAVFEEDELHEGANYVKKERRYNKVQRLISLPTKIQIDHAQAQFADGVLQVTLPKIEKTEIKVE